MISNPAGCKSGHVRTGIVSNQNPDHPYNPNEPHNSVSVCHRPECREKTIRKVAGNTNRQAFYYDDAERRAAKSATA